MKDRRFIRQETPGKAKVCTSCPYNYGYNEGKNRVSDCLLQSWDMVKGSGGSVVPKTFKGVDPPEGCVYLPEIEE